MQSILFVDDEGAVLDALRQALRDQREVWDMHFVRSVDAALDAVHATSFDVVVTDVTMPERDGLDLLQTLQASDATHDVPVVILCDLADIDLKRRALELGAVDLLDKPVVAVDLIARLRSVLRLKSSQDRLREHSELLERRLHERTEPSDPSRPAIIRRLADAGEYRDEQAGNHVVRVGSYCRALSERLGMSREFVETLSLTSTLHDIGKISISDTVLLKEGPLDGTEWAIMKRHCVIGHEILQREAIGPAVFRRWRGDTISARAGSLENPFLEQAATIALTHHERWDGRGYPAGLRTDAIPLEARIVAVADVYDALSRNRPYRRAYPEERVISVMTEEAVGHFDPAVFAAFRAITHELREIRDALADRPRVAA